MKKSSTLFSMLCLVVLLPGCFAMTKPAPTVPEQELTLIKTHDTALDKNTIFNKSLEWIAISFPGFTQSIEMKNKDSGRIVGKGLTEFYNGHNPVSCRFSILVEVKDKKYRVTYSKFTGLWGHDRNMPRSLWHPNHIGQVKANLESLDKKLYEFISGVHADSDW